MNEERTSLLTLRMARAFVAVGFTLVIIQYAFNRPLWGDESALAVNIVERSARELLEPLDHNQVAPIGWLLIEKVVTSAIGISEYALRLFPLLMHLAALAAFYRLGLLVTGSRTSATAAAAFLALSRFFIYYASEVKQYSTDLFLAVLFLYLTLRIDRARDPFRASIPLGLTAVLAPWLSNVSVVVLACCGVFLLISAVVKRRHWNLIWLGVPGLVSFTAYYLLFIRGHPYSSRMRSMWSNYFWDTNPLSPDFYLFPARVVRDFYYDVFGFGPFWPAPLLISLAGMAVLISRKRYKVLFLLTAPALLHLFLSGLELYPFYRRFVLYLLPSAILLFAISWTELVNRLGNISAITAASLNLAPLVALFVPIIMLYPFERPQTGLAAKYVSHRIQPGEIVYVNRTGKWASLYYMATIPELHAAETIVGERLQTDTVAKREADRLEGYDAMWIILATKKNSPRIDSVNQVVLKEVLRRGFVLEERKSFYLTDLYKVKRRG